MAQQLKRATMEATISLEYDARRGYTLTAMDDDLEMIIYTSAERLLKLREAIDKVLKDVGKFDVEICGD